MKKVFSIIVPIAVIALLSGCAKERDNYDKYLTSGTWTLSSASDLDKTVVVKDYVTAGTPTVTSTTDRATNTSGGKSTRVELNQTSLSPGSTTFTRSTEISNYSLSFEFAKDGTVKYSSSSQELSTQNDTHLGNGPVVNSSASPSTVTFTTTWTWGNGTETKEQLNIYGIGMFDVSIKKDALVLTRSTTSKESRNDSDGLGDYAYTEDRTESTTYNFAK